MMNSTAARHWALKNEPLINKNNVALSKLCSTWTMITDKALAVDDILIFIMALSLGPSCHPNIHSVNIVTLNESKRVWYVFVGRKCREDTDLYRFKYFPSMQRCRGDNDYRFICNSFIALFFYSQSVRWLTDWLTDYRLLSWVSLAEIGCRPPFSFSLLAR